MGVPYQFRVQACSNIVCSDYAKTTSVEIKLKGPARPSGVSVNTTSKEITWNDLSTNEAGFEVQRSAKVGGVWSAFADIGQTLANDASYTDSTVTAGKYQYRVRACNPIGCSSYATGAIVVIP